MSHNPPTAIAPTTVTQGSSTPDIRPSAGSSTIVLSDHFDAPSVGVLPQESIVPNAFFAGYVGGEYVLRYVDPTWPNLAITYLPPVPPNASLTVDARLVGETTRRLIALGCRNDNYGFPREYRLVLRPDAGDVTLERWDGGTLERLATSPHTKIQRNTASNRLTLSCAGDTVAADVNGERIVSARDGTLTHGNMWIGVGRFTPDVSQVEARFDNLVVTAVP